MAQPAASPRQAAINLRTLRSLVYRRYRRPRNRRAWVAAHELGWQRLNEFLGALVKLILRWLIEWPRCVAHHLTWLAPLFARITVGWVFLLSGWGKLHGLPQVTENFVGWGVPFAHVLAPFVSGVEFLGGLFLLMGLLTRISAAALGITMIVAIRSAKWADVDSLETLLGFDEFEYLALFLWLAIAGAGLLSIDHLLERWLRGTQLHSP